MPCSSALLDECARSVMPGAVAAIFQLRGYKTEDKVYTLSMAERRDGKNIGPSRQYGTSVATSPGPPISISCFVR